MSTPMKPRPVSDLDVPLSQLAADVRATVARQRACQTLWEARLRTNSPSDRVAYAFDVDLIEHPEWPVSTEADYPGWTPGGTA